MSDDGNANQSRPPEVLTLLNKVGLILGAFDQSTYSLSLTELTARSGLAKATVHRLATELVESGFLERQETRYVLGLRLFELGQMVPRQRILREASSASMYQLLSATNETVHLAIRFGLDVFYINKMFTQDSLRTVSHVAGRLPLHCTATGKVLLAYAHPSVLAHLAKVPLTPVNRRTVTSWVVLRQQLERIREQGYGVEIEETKLGYASIAAPVWRRPGQIVAALSVTGPTSRLLPTEQRVVQDLRKATASICQRLMSLDESEQ